MAFMSADDPDANDKIRKMLGTGQIDQQIRQAIQCCWMMLSDDKKSIDEVEKQVRRIVDRALRDLREDTDAFGLGDVNG